jgi:hypothetical protein
LRREPRVLFAGVFPTGALLAGLNDRFLFNEVRFGGSLDLPENERVATALLLAGFAPADLRTRDWERDEEAWDLGDGVRAEVLGVGARDFLATFFPSSGFLTDDDDVEAAGRPWWWVLRRTLLSTGLGALGGAGGFGGAGSVVVVDTGFSSAVSGALGAGALLSGAAHILRNQTSTMHQHVQCLKI